MLNYSTQRCFEIKCIQPKDYKMWRKQKLENNELKSKGNILVLKTFDNENKNHFF